MNLLKSLVFIEWRMIKANSPPSALNLYIFSHSITYENNNTWGAFCIIQNVDVKNKNTSEYNKTTDWQVSKNLIEQRGIYNEA